MAKAVVPQMPGPSDRRMLCVADTDDAAPVRHLVSVKPHGATLKTQSVMPCDRNGITWRELGAANTPRQIHEVARRPDDRQKTECDRR